MRYGQTLWPMCNVHTTYLPILLALLAIAIGHPLSATVVPVCAQTAMETRKQRLRITI